MKNKGNQEFGHSLSWKELQCLCKKYGLPADKSSSEMAKSLASYFEENLSPLSPIERLGGTREASQPTFVTSGLPSEAPFNFLEDSRKDSKRLNSWSGEEGNRRKCSKQSVNINELGYRAFDKTYDKEGRGRSMHCFQETSNLPFLSQCDKNDLNRKESPTTISCKNYSGFERDRKMEDMHWIQHADVNFVSCPEENVLPSSMGMLKTVSPSPFEFHVYSEDGIDLRVDLSSNPTDWIRKLKSDVDICVNKCDNKSRSFHHERFGESNKQIKSSFPLTVDADQIKDGHVQSRSSPSTFMKENNPVKLNHQDGGDGLLTTSTIEPSIAVVVSENLLEDQGVNSSKPYSDTLAVVGSESLLEDQGVNSSKPYSDALAVAVSENLVEDQGFNSSEPYSDVLAVAVSENLLEDQGVKSSKPYYDALEDFRSCIDENGGTATLDSDIVNIPWTKLAANSVVNVSDCSISVGPQEHQKSKASNVTCEYSALENSCSLVNSQAVIAGGPAGDSMEMPLSEASVKHKDVFCNIGGSLELVDSKRNDITGQGGLVELREPRLDSFRNHLPSIVEEWERSEHIDGDEGSECLQFEDSFEKTCSRLDDVESNEEVSKKRLNIEVEDQNGCGKPDAKILRGTKHFAGEVLPRRSMRLVSK